MIWSELGFSNAEGTLMQSSLRRYYLYLEEVCKAIQVRCSAGLSTPMRLIDR